MTFRKKKLLCLIKIKIIKNYVKTSKFVVIDSSGSRIDVVVGGKVAFVIFHAPIEAIGAFVP